MSTARERVVPKQEVQRISDPLRPEPSKIPAENGLAFARAYARLSEAISHHAGYTLVTGPAGVGKTALVRQVLAEAPVSKAVFASPSTHTPGQIARELAGIGERADGGRLRRALVTRVERAKVTGRPLVVIVDDAHTADLGWLDAVRLTLEAGPDASEWIRLILVGRPALIEMLGRPQARGLWTRVTVRIALTPVSVGDAAGMVYGRLRRAGIDDPESVIPRRTLRSIVRHGHGVPSRCIEITRESLIAAIASGTRKVGRRDIARTARALDAGTAERFEGDLPVLPIEGEPADWSAARALGAAFAVVALVLAGVWLAQTVSESPVPEATRVASRPARTASQAKEPAPTFEPVVQPLRTAGGARPGLGEHAAGRRAAQGTPAGGPSATPGSAKRLGGPTARGGVVVAVSEQTASGEAGDLAVASSTVQPPAAPGRSSAALDQGTGDSSAAQAGTVAATEVPRDVSVEPQATAAPMTPAAPIAIARREPSVPASGVVATGASQDAGETPEAAAIGEPRLAPVATTLHPVPKPVATSPGEAGPVITLVEAVPRGTPSVGSSRSGGPVLIAKVHGNTASLAAGRGGAAPAAETSGPAAATASQDSEPAARSAEPAIWQVARLARGEEPSGSAAADAGVPAAKALAPTSASEPRAIGRGPYAVQVGSFREAARAQLLIAQLGDRFGPTKVEPALAGGRVVYRVRVVDLPDLPAARALQRRLREAGYDSFPVRRR